MASTYTPPTTDALGERRTPAVDGAAEPSVWTYVAVLRRWKRLLIALPIAAALIAATVAFLIPRKYVARASFIPQESSTASRSALAGIAAQFGVAQLGSLLGTEGTTSPAFYVDLMTSQSLLNDVVTTRYTIRQPEPFSGTLVEWFDVSARTPIEKRLKTMKKVREKVVTLGVDRAAGVVGLSVKTTSPELSALIARRYLDLVNDFNMRRRQTRAGAEREFTERRTDEAYGELRAAEAELSSFRTRNRAFVQSSDLTTQQAALERRVSLAQQVYTSLRQQYESAKIEAVRNTPVITVLDTPEGLVEPQSRGVTLAFAGGLVGGFLLALMIVVIGERRRGSTGE